MEGGGTCSSEVVFNYSNDFRCGKYCSWRRMNHYFCKHLLSKSFFCSSRASTPPPPSPAKSAPSRHPLSTHEHVGISYVNFRIGIRMDSNSNRTRDEFAYKFNMFRVPFLALLVGFSQSAVSYGTTLKWIFVMVSRITKNNQKKG